MRLVHVFVPDDRRDAILAALDDADVDYVVTGASSEEGGTLVEFPLPTDAVGDVFNELHDAGLPEDAYTVVGSAETATTGTMELLEDRYANNFSPITAPSLRSKARDLANDWRSYVWLVFLSAVIATGGLIADSPAIVVGSMVIAPLVGPALTAGVGSVTGDREMVVDSVEFQIAGLVVAVAGATAFAFLLKTLGFVPAGLGVTALELVSLRVAPSVVAVVVSVAAGGAAAFSLTTEGPTSLVGVMVAAALVPAAATTGIAIVWGSLPVAVGSFLLLSVTVVGINVGVWTTLRYLGYRSEESVVGRLEKRTRLVVGGLVLVAAVGLVFAGTYSQLSFEREATTAVEEVVDDSRYGEVDVVSVRPSYSSPFISSSRTVTVVLERQAGKSYPDLPQRLRRRISSATGQSVTVRVQYVEYAVSRPGAQPSNGSSGS
ncbi:TIGR00341 family protein [Halomicrococcus gelatinilyticus]|uniref:TIGR00341 family protein n=1 Tax=Halomicrococcus gelatinilyticus TaxID=1702103 RepID=UPI002E121919